MAWIEQTGQHNWRVRYPKPTGGYGSVSGFTTAKAARDYAEDLESDRRHGRWLDPDGAKTTVAAWADRWVDTLDVETRTEEDYRAYLRNHILPRWRRAALGEITALAVTAWIKMLREDYATSTVAGIVTVFSMLLDDAVDERLIPANPVHRRRRRGRRRDHSPTCVERVWAMPDHVLRIADQARTLGGPSASLLVITAAWTGCRWGELAGLQRDHIDLRQRTLTIDPDTGALHESKRHLWLGPPKTPASARTITLPRFLAGLLQMHLTTTSSDFVFTSPLGHPLRRSDFLRRVFRPAVDGNPKKGTAAVRPGLTFHGAAAQPQDVADRRRCPGDRTKRDASATTYPTGSWRPTATSPRKSNTASSATSNSAGTAPPTPTARRTTGPRRPRVHTTRLPRGAQQPIIPESHSAIPKSNPELQHQADTTEANSLQISSCSIHPDDQPRRSTTNIEDTRKPFDQEKHRIERP